MIMTARERFWRTCQFKEPDRVPIQLSGHASSLTNITEDIGPYGYEKVCEYLGISDCEEPIGDFGILNLPPKIMERGHNDFRVINIGGPGRIPLKDYGKNSEERHRLWGFYTLRRNGVIDFPENKMPFINKTSIKDIEEYEFWPDPDDPVFYENIKRNAKKLHEDTGYIIMANGGYTACIDFIYQNLRGFSNWLSDPYTIPDFYIAMKNKITDISIEINKRFYSEIGKYIDMASYIEDMGAQEAPFFSIDYYRKWVMPWQKKMMGAVASLTKAKRWIHSCGSIYDLIPSMIETGFEIINPIQPMAKKMEPWRLKKSFHEKVVFHGGIDLQRLLREPNVDTVVKGVKEVIKNIAPGGGWIAAAANNIPPDVPPKNIFAAFDTIYMYGRYPINIDQT